MKINRLTVLSMLVVLSVTSALAGENLSLVDITRGYFRAESMKAVSPLADGETYSQISDDGKRVVSYSFRTGKQVNVLFDASTARGERIEKVDGYIISPDGKRMLIQTKTTPIYRHSLTAVYYIYDIRNNKLEPLSDGGPQQTPLFRKLHKIL